MRRVYPCTHPTKYSPCWADCSGIRRVHETFHAACIMARTLRKLGACADAAMCPSTIPACIMSKACVVPSHTASDRLSSLVVIVLPSRLLTVFTAAFLVAVLSIAWPFPSQQRPLSCSVSIQYPLGLHRAIPVAESAAQPTRKMCHARLEELSSTGSESPTARLLITGTKGNLSVVVRILTT